MKNQKIFWWALSSALGGFLFGFDTAVISGVEQTLQKLWDLDVFQHGLTVSIALIGTVLGALLAGYPTDQWGRRPTLFLIAILYLLSALGTGLVSDWYLFLFFRFAGGIGVGISSVVAPLYISEIAPPSHRGRLVALFQFNVVFGILMAYLSNYILDDGMPNDWRWMLAILAVPSFFFFVSIFFIPESPRWLILKKGKIQEARAILEVVDASEAEAVIAQIQQSAQATAPVSALFKSQYRRPVILAVLFAVFNQVSGINAIIYFAPRIFEMANLGKESALLSSAGIGLVNLISTLVGLSLIDRFGRRALMKTGSWGLILTLGLVSYAFFTDQTGLLVPVLLFAYIAFFAFSQGAVVWVFISEIFPNEVRAHGQALGSFTHWFMAALIAFTFPYFAENFGGGATFAFFALMMVLQWIFVVRWMPETKGTSLESITLHM
ncbi:MAG: sugar porter family MFS transporter [Spirosomataceae bacterium]